MISGQWLVVSGQWSVVSGQRSVVSGQRSAASGQWSVVAVTGQYTVASALHLSSEQRWADKEAGYEKGTTGSRVPEKPGGNSTPVVSACVYM